MPEPRGWHSRGYLPHFDAGEVAQAVTFRLADALPSELLERWRQDAALLRDQERAAALYRRVQHHLDLGEGKSWLRQPAIATLVEDALLWGDGERYRLQAWAVMPNHVHVLCTPSPAQTLSAIVQGWKSYTSHQANRLLGRQGAFWQADYFDRYIRNARHHEAEVNYIEMNPVVAGLCEGPCDWPFSSARRRDELERGRPRPHKE